MFWNLEEVVGKKEGKKKKEKKNCMDEKSIKK